MANYDLLLCFCLYNIEMMVLKGLIQIMLDFQLDTAVVVWLPIIIAFKVGPGSSQKSWFWVAIHVQCIREHCPERM